MVDRLGDDVDEVRRLQEALEDRVLVVGVLGGGAAGEAADEARIGQDHGVRDVVPTGTWPVQSTSAPLEIREAMSRSGFHLESNQVVDRIAEGCGLPVEQTNAGRRDDEIVRVEVAMDEPRPLEAWRLDSASRGRVEQWADRREQVTVRRGDSGVMVLEGVGATVETSSSAMQSPFDIGALAPGWKGDTGRRHLRCFHRPDRRHAVDCSFDIGGVEVMPARGVSPDQLLEHEDGRVILDQRRDQRRHDRGKWRGESGEDVQFTNRLGVPRGVVDDLGDVIRSPDLHAIETPGGGPCVLERTHGPVEREPRSEERLLE